jgi:peptidyl-prolyl cis-trans isomerase C
MMKLKLLILSTVALCVSCEKQSNPLPPPVAPSPDAQRISQGLLDYYVTQKTGIAADKIDPKIKASLLQALEQLKAAAVAEESRADPTIQEELELQRIELLAHAGAVTAGVFAPQSDEDLKSEYDRFVAGLAAKEFHVAHILVATESLAAILITRLQGGADFAKLAREQSADDSKVRGGDIGWIAPGKLPVELTNAAEALKPGQITTRPVHTIYGWHVIKLLEVRAATPQSFEQVKAQLAANLQQTRYRQFLESALTNAKR